MKNVLFYALVFLFLQTVSYAAVENVQCSNHYKFDGMKFSEFYPEKVAYAQNDTVKISYSLDNQFGSPLVDGALRIIVMYRGTTDIDRTEDDDIIDELYAKDDISINTGDKYEGSFEWKIPAQARPGIYAVNVYYPVKSKFNIAGLTFYTAVPAAVTTFEVKGGDFVDVMLDKNATSLDGNRYLFRAPIPAVEPNTPVTLKTKLNNPGNKNVDVVYELFNWDDVERRLDAFTRTETVSSSKDIEYNLPGLPVGVYNARITATSGDIKSILKVRFFVEGAKGRFIWVGLDHFPLMKGDEATVSFCISNSAVEPGDASVNFTIKGKVTVVDDAGKTISEEQYQAPITAAIDGKKYSFTVPKTMTKATVKADMYDQSGNLMDQVELVYDYSKFLNIERDFKLGMTQTAGAIAYTVKYADKYNDPLDGNVVVYLIAPDGKVAYLNQKEVEGTLNGEINTAGMAEGAYTLKAVEGDAHLTDVKQVNIAQTQQPEITVTPTTQPTAEVITGGEKKQDNTLMIAAIIVVLLIVVVAVARMKKK